MAFQEHQSQKLINKTINKIMNKHNLNQLIATKTWDQKDSIFLLFVDSFIHMHIKLTGVEYYKGQIIAIISIRNKKEIFCENALNKWIL